MLPALLWLVLAIGVPVVALGWLWGRVGWLVAALIAAAGCWAVMLRRWRVRARALQQVGFGLEEYAAAEPAAQRRMVGRLLQRDGWLQVRGVWGNDTGAVHLVGVHPGGRRLGVAFDRSVEAAEDSRAVLRAMTPAAEESTDSGQGPAPLMLVVSAGSFSRERVVWAARSGVHLVDHIVLSRWAAGTDLADLLGVDLVERRNGRALASGSEG